MHLLSNTFTSPVTLAANGTTQPRRILVAIKRVVDYNVRIRVKPDGSGVMLDGVKLSINPFDQIAIEEALRIKERGRADEVVVATIGPADLQATLAQRAGDGRAARAARGGGSPRSSRWPTRACS